MVKVAAVMVVIGMPTKGNKEWERENGKIEDCRETFWIESRTWKKNDNIRAWHKYCRFGKCIVYCHSSNKPLYPYFSSFSPPLLLSLPFWFFREKSKSLFLFIFQLWHSKLKNFGSQTQEHFFVLFHDISNPHLWLFSLLSLSFFSCSQVICLRRWKKTGKKKRKRALKSERFTFWAENVIVCSIRIGEFFFSYFLFTFTACVTNSIKAELVFGTLYRWSKTEK